MMGVMMGPMRNARVLLLPLVLAISCASTPPGAPAAAPGSAAHDHSVKLCQHAVPAEECTKCNPEHVAKFKKMNDWCGEHGIPESHCLLCHPGLVFTPLPALPESADLQHLSTMGEDVPSLGAHVAPGKVTLVDFFATWCAPCKDVDRHVYGLLAKRSDLALRKINIMSWDTPVAKRYLAEVPTLPYVVVFDRAGKQVAALSGLDLAALDQAIAKAGAP